MVSHRIIVGVNRKINFSTIKYNVWRSKVFRQLFQNRKKYQRCQMTIDLWLDSVSFERKRRWPGPSRTSNRHSAYFRAFWKRWFCHVNRGIRDKARVNLYFFSAIFFDGFTLVVSRCGLLVSWPAFVGFHSFRRQKNVFVSWFVVHMFTQLSRRSGR